MIDGIQEAVTVNLLEIDAAGTERAVLVREMASPVDTDILDGTEYRTFDYNTMLRTTWKRTGECNLCGECCKTMIHMDNSPYSSVIDGRTDGATEVDNEGVWHEWEAYGRARYWKIRIEPDAPGGDCYATNGENCYDGSPCKGLLCTAWPLHPDHVKPFPECSYIFTAEEVIGFDIEVEKKFIKVTGTE
jgi:hypothetical protein